MKTAAHPPGRELESIENQNEALQNRLDNPSAVTRLAVVLFATGFALLVVGFLAR